MEARVRAAKKALHKTENVEANKPIGQSNRKENLKEQKQNHDNKMEMDQPLTEPPKVEPIKLKKWQLKIRQICEEMKVRDRPRFMFGRLPKQNKDSG